MANIKSQIKRNKQNEKRHQRNKAVKSELKTLVRKFREAADAGDKDAALDASREQANQIRTAGTQQAKATVLEVREFELAVAHLRVPEMV